MCYYHFIRKIYSYRFAFFFFFTFPTWLNLEESLNKFRHVALHRNEGMTKFGWRMLGNRWFVVEPLGNASFPFPCTCNSCQHQKKRGIKRKIEIASSGVHDMTRNCLNQQI